MTTPTTADQWRALNGDALCDAVMSARWYAQPDDLIGGWCVMPIDLPPSSGAPTVADFTDRRAAGHIATLHNTAIANRAPAHAGPAPAVTSADQTPAGDDMPTFAEKRDQNPFSLARRWADGVTRVPSFRDPATAQKFGYPPPSARGELGELAAMAALKFWMTHWLPLQIHRALAAGATLEQTAAATELDVADVVATWQKWSDGQRHLLLTCPDMPDINAEHDRVAGSIRAQVDGKP